MKKVNLFLVLTGLIGLIIMSSCTPTEKNPPTISVSPSSMVEAYAGDTLDYTLTIASDQELKELKADVKKGSSVYPASAIDSMLETGHNSLTITLHVILPPDVVANDSLNIIFTVIDKEPLSTEATVSVKIKEDVVPAGEINIWNIVLMGAQGSATGSAASMADGGVLTSGPAKDASATVDFIYYYKDGDATKAAEIMSPHFAFYDGGLLTSWVEGTQTFNSTKFVKISMTSTEFDGIADDALIVEKAVNLTEDRVLNLQVGEVYAFQTDAAKTTFGGKLGLALVTALDATTSGSITLKVKVQK